MCLSVIGDALMPAFSCMHELTVVPCLTSNHNQFPCRTMRLYVIFLLSVVNGHQPAEGMPCEMVRPPRDLG